VILRLVALSISALPGARRNWLADGQSMKWLLPSSVLRDALPATLVTQ
jgi:hypothetical protein